MADSPPPLHDYGIKQMILYETYKYKHIIVILEEYAYQDSSDHHFGSLEIYKWYDQCCQWMIISDPGCIEYHNYMAHNMVFHYI